MIIGIDRLTLTLYNTNLTYEQLINNNQFLLVDVQNQNRMYRKTFEIYTLNNEYLGIIFFDNYTNKTHHLKINNMMLYRIGYTLFITQFLKSIEVEKYNYSDLDIYVDSNTNFVTRFTLNSEKIYHRGYESSKYRDATRYEGNYWEREFDKTNNYRYNETLRIANKKGLKSLIFYNKSTELKHSKKDYILSHHKHLKGLNTTKSIHRCELRLSGDIFRLPQIMYQINDTSLLEPHIDLDNPSLSRPKLRYEMTAETYKKLPNEHKEFYTKKKVNKVYKVDLAQMENQDYLATIFYQFAPFTEPMKNQFFNLEKNKIKITQIEYMYTSKNMISETEKNRNRMNKDDRQTEKYINHLSALIAKMEAIKKEMISKPTENIDLYDYIETMIFA